MTEDACAAPAHPEFAVLESIYLQVVEASPDAKIVIDGDGVIVVFNRQAEYLFGHHRSEVIGKKVEVLLDADISEKHAAHRNAYFREPRTREMGVGQVLNGRKRTGVPFPVQIKLAPMVIIGAGLHVLAVVRAVKE